MNITINNTQLPVTIIQNKTQLEKGLKGKRSISGCYLFILNYNENQTHSFWMKDVLIPLDIIFCFNKKIVKIFHNCPPCNTNDCIKYSNKGNVVLEVNGGFCKSNNIKEGDEFYL